MSVSKMKDFARTKHEGLPERVRKQDGGSIGNDMSNGGIAQLGNQTPLPKSQYGSDIVPAALTPNELVLNDKQQTAVMPIPGREHLLKPSQLRLLGANAKFHPAWMSAPRMKFALGGSPFGEPRGMRGRQGVIVGEPPPVGGIDIPPANMHDPFQDPIAPPANTPSNPSGAGIADPFLTPADIEKIYSQHAGRNISMPRLEGAAEWATSYPGGLPSTAISKPGPGMYFDPGNPGGNVSVGDIGFPGTLASVFAALGGGAGGGFNWNRHGL